VSGLHSARWPAYAVVYPEESSWRSREVNRRYATSRYNPPSNLRAAMPSELNTGSCIRAAGAPVGLADPEGPSALRESEDHEHVVGDWHTEHKELGEDLNFTPN
jgi:hypothetical protein